MLRIDASSCPRWLNCTQASGKLGMLNSEALELITLAEVRDYRPSRCCKKKEKTSRFHITLALWKLTKGTVVS